MSSSASRRSGPHEGSLQWSLIIGCMGVVFGEIATSPLYALRIIFTGKNGISPTPDHVMGILSLVFWMLTLVVGIKYALLIMRADNKGDGGIMALLSLVQRSLHEKSRLRRVALTLGLLGASLFFGDAVIAPAISVMGALEGLKVGAPGLKVLIVPITLVILLGLFLLQHRGTAFISGLFSPVMVCWLMVLAVLGVISISHTPWILKAIDPTHALRFLMETRIQSLLVLGAVVLVVTGVEALYADMGHFGIQPIRVAWFSFVYPTLLLNYLGQGALLLRDPSAASNPFYLLAPAWAFLPLLALATLSTIIAAQGVISGAFSLAAQAVRMRYLPRLGVRHTSLGKSGQIYVPVVNWMLAFGTAALVVGFGSSNKLATAYGISVTGSMVVTTILSFGLLRRIWRVPVILTGLIFSIFLIIDSGFLVANLPKLWQGGWVSILISGTVFILLTTWVRGRDLLVQRLNARAVPIEQLVADVAHSALPRVSGTAVYLTASRFGAPLSLLHNMAMNQVVHEKVIILTVITRDEPVVALENRTKIRHYGGEIYRVRIYYGYNQEPNIPEALSFCRSQGLDIDLAQTSFFLTREHMISSGSHGVASWRERLYIRMAMNAENAMRFWHIPPERVVELGHMVAL
jgi:KUP system potassium uptake protein